MLKEFGGGLDLTENWTCNVLKSMNWTKRKGTTAKVEPFKRFLEEEKFTSQRKISNVLLDHSFPSALLLNLEQIPFSYASPWKYTFSLKESKKAPLKGLDDKRKNTGTFVVSATGSFLPIHLIYQGKSKRYFPPIFMSHLPQIIGLI